MSRVMAGMLTVAQGAECRALMRVADEIESVADYCERLANYRRRLVRDGVVFDDERAARPAELPRPHHRAVRGHRRPHPAPRHRLAARHRDQGGSTWPARPTRCATPTCSAWPTQRIAPAAGIFFNDMLVAMRRIRNHSLNLAEAFGGTP